MTLMLTLFVSMMIPSILRAEDVTGPGKVAPTNGPAGSVYGPIAYDPSGNIITVGSDSGVSNDYTYDPMGRIVAAAVQRSGNVQSQGYGYDAYGNRTAVTGVNAMTYSVDAATNRLGSGSPHYAQYDSVGNMTTWLPPGSVASREYTYDALNMVTKESAQETSGTQTVYHIYTADDERYWSLHVLPDGSNRSDDTIRDLSGQVLRDYLEGPGGFSIEQDYIYRDGLLLGAVTATGNQHYTLDHLGTPRLVTDQSGAKLAEHTYYPFGVELTDGSPTDGLLKYTGHERDPDLLGEAAGVTDYMHARYYAPGMGRFLSVDTFPGSRHSPQSWNRYSYVRNSPLGSIDPDGRCTFRLGDGTTYVDPNTVCVEVSAEDPGPSYESIFAATQAQSDLYVGQMIAWSDNQGYRIARPMLMLLERLRRDDPGLIGQSYGEQLAAVGLGRAGLGVLGMFRGGSQESSFFDGARFDLKGKPDPHHNFPEGVAAFEDAGTMTTFTGGDGRTYVMLEIQGAYRGTTGTFEFIKRADTNEIVHWFFNSVK
jgi:RHS repeat-associated protein